VGGERTAVGLSASDQVLTVDDFLPEVRQRPGLALVGDRLLVIGDGVTILATVTATLEVRATRAAATPGAQVSVLPNGAFFVIPGESASADLQLVQ
jgi:hypothetical protein